MITIILFAVCIFTFLYFVAIKPHNYWSKKNVPTGDVVPFFGDFLQIVRGKESFTGMTQRTYNRLPDARYVGVYHFTLPLLVLRTPEIIKQVCVKDFDYFVNHKETIPDGIDDLFSKNLAALKGQAWKSMRCTLSPSFTSSKMKSMYPLICRNANLVIQYFMQKGEETVEVEFKEMLTKYTNDVIASTTFGIDVDSLKDSDNEFYKMGRHASDFSGTWRRLIFFLYQLAPGLSRYFKIQIFNKKVKAFFVDLVRNTIKIREEQNINRSDMIGLLMKARKGQQVVNEIDKACLEEMDDYFKTEKSRQDLTDSDIASQVFIFFIAGFDSVANAMCFVAYELAANPDVQKKLIAEIDENRPASGDPSYETLVNMTYMDMVVSEAVRKWPIAVATDRLVTKPYTIQPELPGEKPVSLDVGDNIFIPIYTIHHDPKYYENPEKFDPERFSSENRKNMDPYTYLPFGVGPRNCIGFKFGVLEIKTIFFYLLSHFEIVPVEKTHIPLRISKTSLNLNSENGFPLGLKRRS